MTERRPSSRSRTRTNHHELQLVLCDLHISNVFNCFKCLKVRSNKLWSNKLNVIECNTISFAGNNMIRKVQNSSEQWELMCFLGMKCNKTFYCFNLHSVFVRTHLMIYFLALSLQRCMHKFLFCPFILAFPYLLLQNYQIIS